MQEKNIFEKMRDDAVQALLNLVEPYIQQHGFDVATFGDDCVIGYYNSTDDKEFSEQNADVINFRRCFNDDPIYNKMWIRGRGWV